jgi:tetrahydromethanopterin S-methyltransferase subunit G
MTIANQKGMISSEEARIMLLEQKNDDFNQTLLRIEKRLDSLDTKLDAQNNKIDSHFRWTIGLIFGLYATSFGVLLGAVGKAYHWF